MQYGSPALTLSNALSDLCEIGLSLCAAAGIDPEYSPIATLNVSTYGHDETDDESIPLLILEGELSAELSLPRATHAMNDEYLGDSFGCSALNSAEALGYIVQVPLSASEILYWDASQIVFLKRNWTYHFSSSYPLAVPG